MKIDLRVLSTEKQEEYLLPAPPSLPLGNHGPRTQPLQQPPGNTGLLLRFFERVLSGRQTGGLSSCCQRVEQPRVGRLGGRAGPHPDMNGGGRGGGGGGGGRWGGRGGGKADVAVDVDAVGGHTESDHGATKKGGEGGREGGRKGLVRQLKTNINPVIALPFFSPFLPPSLPPFLPLDLEEGGFLEERGEQGPHVH